MKVLLIENWARDGYDLLLYEEQPGYRVPYKFENGRFITSENDTVQYGEIVPPAMFLDRVLYEALRSAMIGEAIEKDDALQDTRNVRDRLLTMIEKKWK